MLEFRFEILELNSKVHLYYLIELIVDPFLERQNLQPSLSGNPFLLVIRFYLIRKFLQKRLGAEDGIVAQII